MLLLSSIWALILLIAYFLVIHFNRSDESRLRPGYLRPQYSWFSLVIIALLARLVPNFILPMGAGYDIQSFQIVGGLVAQGKDVYSEIESENRHPYLPLQLYWMALSQKAAEFFKISFVNLIRLAPIFADVVICLVLYFLLIRSSSPFHSYMSALLYAVNPIPVYISAYHGQFDSIPMLFILLALFNQIPRSSLREDVYKNIIASGSWLGIGILVKSWPVLTLPSFLHNILTWKNRLLFLAFVLLIPFLGISLYAYFFKANPIGIISQALSYNHGIGVWGYTYFVRLLTFLRSGFSVLYDWLIQYGRWLTLAGVGIAYWLTIKNRQPLSLGILSILLSFLVITHAFSIQYLVWVVPFAILQNQDRWLKRYTLAAFAYMFLAYNVLILEPNITKLIPLPQADLLIIIPSGLLTWLICIGWVKELLFDKPRPVN